MTKNKAIKLAIVALEEKRKRLYAFNAKLYEMGVHSFRTEKDKKSYDEINQAVEILLEMK